MDTCTGGFGGIGGPVSVCVRIMAYKYIVCPKYGDWSETQAPIVTGGNVGTGVTVLFILITCPPLELFVLGTDNAPPQPASSVESKMREVTDAIYMVYFNLFSLVNIYC